jgi:glycopeptide antibiotics resistance protein
VHHVGLLASETRLGPCDVHRMSQRQRKIVLDGLIAMSVLGILLVTLWPARGAGGTRVHLLPLMGFWEKDPYRTSIVPGIAGAVANLLLFIPLGFLVGVRWRFLDRWGVVLALGIGFSLAIEATQFLLGGHDSSFDDVLMNSLGAVCGHALSKAFVERDAT